LKCITDVFATYSIADSIVHTNSFIILSIHKITETSNTEQSPLTRYCTVDEDEGMEEDGSDESDEE
jgi:hypothetical protein